MFISEWLLPPPHLCIYNTKSCSSLSSFLHHSHSLQGTKVLDLFGDPRYQTITAFTDTSADGKALNLQVSLFSGGTEEERQQDMSKFNLVVIDRAREFSAKQATKAVSVTFSFALCGTHSLVFAVKWCLLEMENG